MKFSNKFLFFSQILFIFAFFISCTQNFSENSNNNLYVHPKKQWNYLIYMAADNNLERFALKNIKSLQKIGSTENINFIVLLDRANGYDKSEGNWTGTKLFYISKTPKFLNDDIIFDYGELDMTDSVNLYNFLITTNNYFPAEYTVLNIWSHGNGVYPDGIIQKSSRSIIEDYTTGYNSKDSMSIIDFSTAIKKYEEETNKFIDIIQFDACYMQMLEVCYELKNVCNFIVGSEIEIPGYGSDYESIAKFLLNNSNCLADELALFLVQSFYDFYKKSSSNFIYSSINCKKFNLFLEEFNNFCNKIINLNEDIKLKILEKRAKIKNLTQTYPEYIDLENFFILFSEFDLQNDIQKVKEQLNNLIFYKIYSDNLSTSFSGISLNFPYTKSLFSYYKKEISDYKTFRFYEDSLFNELINSFYSLSINFSD